MAANAETKLNIGDKILIISDSSTHAELTTLIGEPIQQEWIKPEEKLVSRKIIFTKPKLNGAKLSKLNIRKEFGVNITRINRAGVDLAPTANFRLQIGDVVTIVGNESAIESVKKLLGDERKYLDHPNLIPIFIGIAIGCVAGSIPLSGTLISTPLKLGLAGGPLIVAILVSYFGPKFHDIAPYSQSTSHLAHSLPRKLYVYRVYVIGILGISLDPIYYDKCDNNGHPSLKK